MPHCRTTHCLAPRLLLRRVFPQPVTRFALFHPIKHSLPGTPACSARALPALLVFEGFAVLLLSPSCRFARSRAHLQFTFSAIRPFLTISVRPPRPFRRQKPKERRQERRLRSEKRHSPVCCRGSRGAEQPQWPRSGVSLDGKSYTGGSPSTTGMPAGGSKTKSLAGIGALGC
jgi:hypothetical protein